MVMQYSGIVVICRVMASFKKIPLNMNCSMCSVQKELGIYTEQRKETDRE